MRALLVVFEKENQIQLGEMTEMRGRKSHAYYSKICTTLKFTC